MKSLTTIILQSEKRKFLTFWDYIPTIFFSALSVFFSMALVVYLKDVVGTIELIGLGVFLPGFLILNEAGKYQQLNTLFTKGKINISGCLLLIVTFALSLGLQAYGIFLLTNKTTNIEADLNGSLRTEIKAISEKYNSLISNINNQSLQNLPEYQTEQEAIKYWQRHKNLTVYSYGKSSENIQKHQENSKQIASDFNKKKEAEIALLRAQQKEEIAEAKSAIINKQQNFKQVNYIMWIFIALTVLTEFATIGINRWLSLKQLEKANFVNSEAANNYKTYRKIVYALYITKQTGSTIVIADLGTNPVKWINTPNCRTLLALLASLGIINEHGIIVEQEEQALKLIDEYYERIL